MVQMPQISTKYALRSLEVLLEKNNELVENQSCTVTEFNIAFLQAWFTQVCDHRDEEEIQR